MAKAKPIPELECNTDAREGARLVLLARLHETCELRAQALDWSDIEGVHDMRVASRRLRSALRDFRKLIKKSQYAELRDAAKTLADALGAVRDQDVALEQFNVLLEQAPMKVKPGVQIFIDERTCQRNAARARLVEMLTEENIDKVQTEFTAHINKALGGNGSANSRTLDAGQSNIKSFADFGRTAITQQWARLHDQAACIYDPTAVEPLHDLRIEAKRLRYALELFAVCAEELNQFAKEIAELQSALGEIHDCDVWIENAGATLRNDGTTAESAARDAAVWLIDKFIRERTKFYRRALARWHKWEKTNFAARLSETLAA